MLHRRLPMPPESPLTVPFSCVHVVHLTLSEQPLSSPCSGRQLLLPAAPRPRCLARPATAWPPQPSKVFAALLILAVLALRWPRRLPPRVCRRRRCVHRTMPWKCCSRHPHLHLPASVTLLFCESHSFLSPPRFCRSLQARQSMRTRGLMWCGSSCRCCRARSAGCDTPTPTLFPGAAAVVCGVCGAAQ